MYYTCLLYYVLYYVLCISDPCGRWRASVHKYSLKFEENAWCVLFDFVLKIKYYLRRAHRTPRTAAARAPGPGVNASTCVYLLPARQPGVSTHGRRP
jgi:hypothetical protein